MTKYMLAVHSPRDAGPREPMTDEQVRQGYALVAALEEEMNAANALVFSARLTEPGLADPRGPLDHHAATGPGPRPRPRPAPS